MFKKEKLESLNQNQLSAEFHIDNSCLSLLRKFFTRNSQSIFETFFLLFQIRGYNKKSKSFLTKFEKSGWSKWFEMFSKKNCNATNYPQYKKIDVYKYCTKASKRTSHKYWSIYFTFKKCFCCTSSISLNLQNYIKIQNSTLFYFEQEKL